MVEQTGSMMFGLETFTSSWVYPTILRDISSNSLVLCSYRFLSQPVSPILGLHLIIGSGTTLNDTALRLCTELLEHHFAKSRYGLFTGPLAFYTKILQARSRFGASTPSHLSNLIWSRELSFPRIQMHVSTLDRRID